MTDATEPRPTPCLEIAHVLFTDLALAANGVENCSPLVTPEYQPDRDDEKMSIVSWQDGINQPPDREWSNESQQTCQGEANKTCNMQGELRFDLRE